MLSLTHYSQAWLKSTKFESKVAKRLYLYLSYLYGNSTISFPLSLFLQFFIADGYCNSRILKFNAAGKLLRSIPQPPGAYT